MSMYFCQYSLTLFKMRLPWGTWGDDIRKNIGQSGYIAFQLNF